MPTVEEMELKQDDGNADGFSSQGWPYGYSVRFSPPTTPFTISSVKVMAKLYGTEHAGRKALLEIWNQDFEVLFSCEIPAMEFTLAGGWVTVETNITADDDFRVVFFTGGAPSEGGIAIGGDKDGVNRGSELVTSEHTVQKWFSHWEKTGPGGWPEGVTNWMIRVEGSATPTGTPSQTPTAEEIELKYDDGTGEGSCSSGHYGFLVHFSPSAIPLNISKVKLFTCLQGSAYESQTTRLEIRDNNLELLYDQGKPANTYSSNPTWVTIETPGIQVNGDFHVVFYPSSSRDGGVYLYFDSSQTNNFSETAEAGGKIAEWVWRPPKETTNWMIRVIGTYMAPAY